MLDEHLRKHRFMFGTLGIDPATLSVKKQKSQAWSQIKQRFHPPVSKMAAQQASLRTTSY